MIVAVLPFTAASSQPVPQAQWPAEVRAARHASAASVKAQSSRWTHDPESGRATITPGDRSGPFEQAWVRCESGQPVFSLRYRSGREPPTPQVNAQMGEHGDLELEFRLVREGNSAIWSARPVSREVLAMLAGSLSDVTIFDRADAQGALGGWDLSLAGSSNAITAALRRCGGGASRPSPATAGSDETQIRALVTSIYDDYAGEPGADTGAGEPTMSPGLSAVISRFEAAWGDDGTGEGIGYDPFCQCQDWVDTRYVIRAVSVRGDTAQARVDFTNFDQTLTITLRLVKTPAGWRVDDIIGRDGVSLRADLQRRPGRR